MAFWLFSVVQSRGSYGPKEGTLNYPKRQRVYQATQRIHQVIKGTRFAKQEKSDNPEESQI